MAEVDKAGFTSVLGPPGATPPPEDSAQPDYFSDLNLDQVVASITAGREAYHLEPFRAPGLPFCYPTVTRTTKEALARDSFDVALAAKLVAEGTPVVCNDIELREPERILVVSGPSSGGKTAFARQFGQLHHLACLGCPVPCTEATLHLFDRLCTRFGRAEKAGDRRGPFEEDPRRARAILAEATADSALVLNEVFGSTSLEDARFLGRKTLGEIIERDALGVCVTFVAENDGVTYERLRARVSP